MSETLEVAEPSFEIPRSNTAEYQQWRETGNVAKAETTEPAAVDPSKETPSDTAPDPESGTKPQEPQKDKPKAKPVAEARIAELTARTKQLERELEEARKPKEVKADTAPAKPKTYQEYRKNFKAEAWTTEYAKANPEATYEDVQAAMVDHLADARDHFRTIEQQEKANVESLQQKMDDATKRYPDSKDAIFSMNEAIFKSTDIPLSVKEMIYASDILPDLLYTLSDSDKFDEFVDVAKKNQGKGMRYVAALENGIIEALAKAEKPRTESGQFAKEESAKVPVKRGPESVPAPPIEVGSRGGSMDEGERALQAVERGDAKAMAAWMAAENRKDLARRNGV